MIVVSELDFLMYSESTMDETNSVSLALLDWTYSFFIALNVLISSLIMVFWISLYKRRLRLHGPQQRSALAFLFLLILAKEALHATFTMGWYQY